MRNPEWVDLLRNLPAPLQENLVLNTTAGSELAIQKVICAGGDYLLIRGRLTGTTDEAAFFLVPFERINYLGLPKSLKEDMVRDLFKVPVPSESAEETPASPQSSPDPAATPSTDSASTGSAQPIQLANANGQAGAAPNVDKAALLERLRARRP
jgi:hypothetical protein